MAHSKEYHTLALGVGGFDLVSYHSEGKAQRGSGYYMVEHQGVLYLFASEEHKAMFEKEPEKYLPAYGGYCAYGVSVGKKFASNPEVWKIVDGVLYLNLDKDIQSTWLKDMNGNIRKADKNWEKIQRKSPKELMMQ